jgi:hypothetical protein
MKVSGIVLIYPDCPIVSDLTNSMTGFEREPGPDGYIQMPSA